MSFGFPTSMSPVWYRYEAARSFDLDDDLEFCPGLLSEDEMQFIGASYSDRSSSSSGSPNSSPLQIQIQPSNSSPYHSSHLNSSTGSFGAPITKLALTPSSSSRPRNAIPIVNPQTGMRVSSPPLSTNSSRTSIPTTQLSRRPW